SSSSSCSWPEPPSPCFHYDHNRAQFYVEDATTASALKQVSRKIIDRDNYKVVIIINASGPPQSLQNELKPEEIEQVKLCMSKRYDGSQKSLDLKSLRTDPDLVSQSIDMVLNQRSCMQVVLRIIEENIPEVRAASRRDLALTVPSPAAMRFKLLKHTRLNVVAFLNELPKTQHDVNSFVVDVCAQTVSGGPGGDPGMSPGGDTRRSHPLRLPRPAEHAALLRCARHLQGRWVPAAVASVPPAVPSPCPPPRVTPVTPFLGPAVDGKSRDSVRAFTRMFIAVPAGNTG
uniref:Uncharacterized protein n=1 Tax=Nothoprocta perdicaria TaxID=30464 RepID=A0A8C7EH14_NOTPE